MNESHYDRSSSPWIDYSNPPVYGLPPFPAGHYGYGRSDGVWRKGETLVMHKNAALPDRCIKCNAPTHGSSLKRKLSWHHPAWVLLIFGGLLVYLIAIQFIRKRATVHIGLCKAHLKKYHTSIAVRSIVFSLGFLCIIMGISLGSAYYALAGVALIIAGMVYSLVAVPAVQVTRMDDYYIWLKRINREYLAELPQLP
jgi:hypothetical protein